MPIADQVTAEKYAETNSRERGQWLRQRAHEAEWTLPQGPAGDVIAQLRYRGRVAEDRSRWLLGVLIFVVLMGLGFYLLLPFWKQFVDGQRATLNQTITAVELVGRDLSDTREKLLMN